LLERKIKIAPSILSADFSRLGEQVAEATKAGADYIHVDVMDGHFVPNITIGPLVVSAVRKCTKLPLDVHLMIESPDKYIQTFADAGADIITVHVEACPHINRTIQFIKSLNRQAGVSLNPGTPLEQISEVLASVDLILIMTVNPGFGGQAFIPEVLNKITRLSKELKKRKINAELEVDGGINVSTAPEVVKAGAQVLVAGAAIFNSTQTIAEAIRKMKNSVVNF
jgi:ribulose-phosphate 3-epimerase